MTLSFTDRLAIGLAHEQEVAAQLALRGWTVDPWGQGILSPATRAAVQRTDSHLRWTPDFIATRDGTVVLIDAKASTSRDTNRHAITRSSLRAGMQYEAWTELPLYYIFSDLRLATPHAILHVGSDQADRRPGGAWVFVNAETCRPLDDVFGQPAAWKMPLLTLQSAA